VVGAFRIAEIINTAEDNLELRFTDPAYWRDWKPDAAHINALPEPVRKFIHDLATRADPAGDVQEIAALRDQYAALIKKIAELKSEQQSE
jgi:hypothetical protein